MNMVQLLKNYFIGEQPENIYGIKRDLNGNVYYSESLNLSQSIRNTK